MTKKHDIIVVGAGLFGCIAAALARAEGHRVTLIGLSRPYEASPASGCVLAPSWLGSLEKTQVADAMAVLASLYTLHPLEFRTNVGLKFKAQRVHTPDILTPPDIQGRVTALTATGVRYTDLDGADHTLRGIVLVCTGVWGRELVPSMPAIRGLYGVSLRIPGQLIEPVINAYAPYRQAVAFNMDKRSVWFGDGTALIAKTWDAEERARVLATVERAKKVTALSAPARLTHVIGARPYVEGHKAGYFERVTPRLYVSNGGAKNGTVLAAWQALNFVNSLP